MSGISILMYHQVGRFPPMREHRGSYCDIDRFRAQMRYLRMSGMRMLAMNDVVRALHGEVPMPPRAVALTFDDAYENFYENALPILRRYNFPAIVYVPTKFVGGPASWLTGDRPIPSLMSWSRLRELTECGVDIGAHSVSHARLAGLAADALRTEVVDSKAIIEDKLGRPVDHFCYPYGTHDRAALDAVAAAGYASAVTCQRGAATPAFDAMALPRKGISFQNTIFGFAWKLYMKDKPKGVPMHRGH